MAPIYPCDPDQIQEQLLELLPACRKAQEKASGLWDALTGLRRALDAADDDEDSQGLREMGQRAQQAHQAARYRADVLADAVKDLTRQLRRISDTNLAGRAA